MNYIEEDRAFLSAITAELTRARTKFPSSNLSFAALVEEVGELAEAMLKHRAGMKPKSAVLGEAVQVAVMALRVAVEGDDSFKIEYSEPHG